MTMQTGEATPVTASTVLADPATADGLRDLAEKAAPLLQGHRFHNIIDMLSAASDMVDMADDQLTQKLAKAFEEVVWAGWAGGNAVRAATAVTANTEPPTLWQLSRRMKDPDVRRGLAFVVALMGAVGRQVEAAADVPDDD